MKCGCKRNLLGVCSCKRVSRGRGRKTRRALTDEPYERAIRPRYAVPRSRRPELNFPEIDPKRPGQVLRPGVPSVSKGFTAPSPFSTGATSAFGPVLQAASNYLNEVTRSARLQNQITMSNMGGGGSAGSRSNIAVNGSVNSRNTQNILSANPGSAPINENVNVINPDGSYQAWRNHLEEFQNNAYTAIRNLNRTAAISAENSSVNDITPQNNINYQDQIDDNDSVQVLANEDQEILADNQRQNENLNNLINQELNQEPPLYDNDIWLFNALDRADEVTQERFLRKLNEKGDLDIFAKNLERWRQLGNPEPNMAQVDTSFKQNVANFLNNETPPSTPVQPPPSSSKEPFSSDGSPMYPSGVVEINSNYKLQNPDPNAIKSLMNTGFSSPVFAKANSSGSSSSSSNIGGNSKSSKLRKLKSIFGDQDKEDPPRDQNKEEDTIQNTGVFRGMDNIIPESETESGSSLNTDDQMEPSEYTEGSVPISSVSSKSRQSADDKVIAEQREREKKGPGLTVRGKGNKVIEPIETNIYKDQQDMQALENADLNTQLNYIRQLVARGHLKEDQQRRLLEDAEKLKQVVNTPVNQAANPPVNQTANATVNVLVPKSIKKKGGGLGFTNK
jgi:hypothetical protein